MSDSLLRLSILTLEFLVDLLCLEHFTRGPEDLLNNVLV